MTTAMQEAFEAEMLRCGISHSFFKWCDGKYTKPVLAHQWFFWQAACAWQLEELRKQEPVGYVYTLGMNRVEHTAIKTRKVLPNGAALYAAPIPPTIQKEHRWSNDGETCLDCGDKDWMGGRCNAQPMPEGEKK